MSAARSIPALAVLAVAHLAPAAAWAASFHVSPTRVDLRADQRSGLVAISNPGPEPIRFQVSVFQWSESAAGQMILEPSDDIVVFPTLLEIEAGETRRLRVGTSTTATEAERTYRMVVEELPPLVVDEDGQGALGIRVLTRASIPVFVRPARLHTSGSVASTRVQEGLISVDVVNAGNVHFKVQQVEVVGRDARGAAVFQEEVRGWYVLPEGTRTFEVPVPADACALTVEYEVHAITDRGTWSRTEHVAPRCGT